MITKAYELSKYLVTNSLATCVQIDEVNSIYKWQNEVNTTKEYRLMVKTLVNCYPNIESYILQNHNYELPEIICIPIEKGYSHYLNWILDNTTMYTRHTSKIGGIA